MTATLADDLGQRLLGMAEVIHQPPEAFRLLQGGQVLPLQILDERHLQRLAVGEIADEHRHFVQPRPLRRPPAPLAGDNLERRRVVHAPPHQERLQDAFGGDRLGQFVEFGIRHPSARLKAAGAELVDADAARGLQPIKLGVVLAFVAEKGRQPPPETPLRIARHQATRARSRRSTSLAKWT